MLLVMWPDLQTMLASIMDNLPPLWNLATGFAFVTGMIFTMRGIYILKEYGELRTMMASQTSLKKPLTFLICGSALVYTPATFHMALESLFAQSTVSPLAWSTSDYDSWHGVITVLVNIVEFVGVVAFIRGWIIISAIGGHQAQPNSFGKAMTHIVGGILAVNITGTASVLSSTLHINII